MTRAETTTPGHAVVWTVVILLLLACRLPSLVEPAGADQSLYAYVGQQINAGHVAYRDAWDQKPPAVHFIYALLWRMWPDDAVVAAADLAAAGLIAWLLVILGSRTLGRDIGFAAAGLFLLLGDPAIQRLSGVRVRSQCETFIALAIVVALVLMTGRRQTRWHALAAGCFFAAAFWLKYNAAAYALPVAIAAGLQPRASRVDRPPLGTQLFFIGVGFGAISAAFLVYFAAAGALRDLWLATISYNLQYSSETYSGPGAVAGYVLFPLQRARIDLLWYLGGAGLLTLLITHDQRARWLAFAWIAAACLSVAINGARDLPQYFIQANPALAFAAAAGLSLLWRAGMRPAVRIAAVAVLLVGLWKVGDEPVAFRLGGLSEAARNTAFDLRYARGAIDRRTYLGRFQQQSDAKYVPLSSEQLIQTVRATTKRGDRILVFGLAANVYVDSPRESASRFFWSRPVVVEFGRGIPGYGSAGLLQDLQRTEPALVALQKHWGDQPPIEFFIRNEPLREWLEQGYVLADDSGEFAVWRRRS